MKNYRMPAEWEKQERVWLGWPGNASDWPGKLSAVRWAVADMVRLLSRFQPVSLLVADEAARRRAGSMLARAGADMRAVDFHIIPHDRTWLRDSGPIFAKDEAGGTVALCFGFNAWAKYPDFHRDKDVAGAMAMAAGIEGILPMWKESPVVLEGGAVDVNGAGMVLATEECLLDPEVQVRNPGFSREDYEGVFASYLGAGRTIWLGRGIAGDDTHGHVDDFCRFTAPDTVVLCREDDKADPNHAILEENRRRLAAVPGLKVADLPMPGPQYFSGLRLPASYANFLIAGQCVLVPTFNDPMDRRALGVLADLFPDRAVAGVHSLDLVWGFGAVHCLTKQQPR